MNPSKGLLGVLLIVAACIAGWVWYGPDSGWTNPGSTGGTGKVQPDDDGKPMQAGAARSEGDGKAPIDREDPEWSRFGRANVVVPAISTIPKLFRASDTYRDEALNPRDIYIPPPHRKQLSAIVDSFMPRIREADRQAMVAQAEAAKTPTPANAVQPTKNNMVQTTRGGTRQDETLELQDAIALAEASGRPASQILQEVRSLDAVRPSAPSAKAAQPAITPQPVIPEPLRLRQLSISLREELLDQMTKLLVGKDVLRQLEANAIRITVKRRLHNPQPQPLKPK